MERMLQIWKECYRYGKNAIDMEKMLQIWKGLEDTERIRRFGKDAEIRKWLSIKKGLGDVKRNKK